MGFKYADRIRETTTSTGTGDLTLLGAVAKFFAVSSEMADGDTFDYLVEHQTANEFEEGTCTYVAATPAIARTTVHRSSNANALVDFSAGTKDVRLVLSSRRVAGRQTINIPAVGMLPRLTNGPSTGYIETGTNKVMIATLDFDASTEEYAQFTVDMPKGWDAGTFAAVFSWSHAATTTNFGVVWGIRALALSDDDAIDTAFGTAVTVTDTGGTTNDKYRSAETAAITASNTPAEYDSVTFEVYRKAADGADTLAIDARLHGVTIYYSATALNDA